MEKKFNLLEEPWIRVLDENGLLKEVSILEALREAHRFKKLAGELPTQDVALLRLLLAILYCVFTRLDTDGRPSDDIKSENDALKRWQALWQKGAVPFAPIASYLNHYKDKFYLFHPQRPFYQVAGLSKGTEYEAAKLNGLLAESSNKVRLFANRSQSGKKNLTYAEAARWLPHLNGFDDTSGKPSADGKKELAAKDEKMLSPGAGYLGKLGLVYAAGDNLFETLMLNLVFYPYPSQGQAVWEADTVRTAERQKIDQPNSQQQLLTLQSRRLLLLENATKDMVSGYRLLGGDFFSSENYFTEHMTLWRKDTANKKDEIFKPKRHNTAKAFWRDFAALTGKEADKNTEKTKKAGIVDWIAKLSENKIINDRRVYFQIASVQYGDKDFFVDNVFGDYVAVNTSLLEAQNDSWVGRIVNELEITRQCVSVLRRFVEDLENARGYRKDPKKAAKDIVAVVQQAESEAYFSLDMPFRQWLMSIVPGTDVEEDRVIEWRQKVRQLLLAQGQDILNQTDDRALTGKLPQADEKPNVNNAFQAHAKFKNIIYKLTYFVKGVN